MGKWSLRSWLLGLAGFVLVAVGAAMQITVDTPVATATSHGRFDPGPLQVLELGAMVLLFAVAVNRLERN